MAGEKTAARVTDLHTCPETTGPVPRVGGPIIVGGCPTVLIGMGAAPPGTADFGAVGVSPPGQSRRQHGCRSGNRKSVALVARWNVSHHPGSAMIIAEFRLDIGYGQMSLFHEGLDRPFNEWTSRASLLLIESA